MSGAFDSRTSGGDRIAGGVTFAISRAIGVDQLTLDAFRRVHLEGTVAVSSTVSQQNTGPQTFTGTLTFNDSLDVFPLEPRADKTFTRCEVLGLLGQVTAAVEVKVRVIAELQSDLSVNTQRIASVAFNCGGNSNSDAPGVESNIAVDEQEPIAFSLTVTGSASATAENLLLRNAQSPPHTP